MVDPKHKLELRSVRLEALGDGIFAVAMTILAFELKWPNLPDTSLNSFVQSFRHILPDLLCYVISFVILGIMWFGHRMVFEYIGKTNRHFIFLGVIFYMMICLVPFSTRFLAENKLQWGTILVYGLNLSFCNLALYAQWSYAIHRKDFLDRELPHKVKMAAKISFLISPFIYAIAIVFSFWLPQLSIIFFIITPLLYLLPNELDKYLP